MSRENPAAEDSWSTLPPPPVPEAPGSASTNNPQSKFRITERTPTRGYQPAQGRDLRSSENLAGDPATIERRLAALRRGIAKAQPPEGSEPSQEKRAS